MKDDIARIKRTKQVQSNWYRERYPDVAHLGMDPAEHYLKYGAMMGRNPGKGFDTRFYLEQNPDAARSDMNPLLHYAEHGAPQGFRARPANADLFQAARKRIDIIRGKLLSLGFTDRPLAELTEIATGDDNPAARALAARELALWQMRARTEAGYRTALEHIAAARADAPNLYFRSRLATAELLCQYQLGQQAEGRAAYDRAALAGEADPDVMLAWVNFQPTPEARIAWINQILRQHGIAPVALTDDTALPPYDRLTAAEAPAKVADGPLVTVLIAAYDAADMLPTALRSLQEQSWQNLEILVIDDASPTPDTAEVAERFAATDPRIRVLRMPENGGAYVARNAGLDAANGTYVTLHDADDWSHPAKIETQVRFMEENPEVMGCTSEQARSKEDLTFHWLRHTGGFIIFNTSSLLFRKNPVTRKLGYWDTVRYGADSEFIQRIKHDFGRHSLARLQTGPLSFQREVDGSATSDDVTGVGDAIYGARLEYRESQSYYHSHADTLYYDANPLDRPFPAPRVMTDKKGFTNNTLFDIVVVGCFSAGDEQDFSLYKRLRALRNKEKRIGLISVPEYENYHMNGPTICDEIRNVIDGDRIVALTFGDKVDAASIERYRVNTIETVRYTAKVRLVGSERE